MKPKWKLVSVLSKIVLTLTQDRCTVCIEGTIGSEIILYPMELQGDIGHVECLFVPFGHSASVSAR
jgi:hypothetical protein